MRNEEEFRAYLAMRYFAEIAISLLYVSLANFFAMKCNEKGVSSIKYGPADLGQTEVQEFQDFLLSCFEAPRRHPQAAYDRADTKYKRPKRIYRKLERAVKSSVH